MTPPNYRAAIEAAMTLFLHIRCQWCGASKRGRSASQYIDMNKHLQGPPRWLLALLAGAGLLANAADSERSQLPKADEYSTSGLQIECHPEKPKFVIGEPVILRCAITNTTDSVKRIGSYPASYWSPQLHFRCVKNEASWMSGVLPEVTLQIHLPITRNEFGIFLPPHTTLEIVLTRKSSRAEMVGGILVYDPSMHGGGLIGNDGLEKAKRACIFSNPFEYEVMAAEKKK